MKPTAFLLNVARGGVVDEAALAAALTAGTIAGAAVDVFATEPPAADNPLLDAPNTVLTPHLGASTAEAQVAVAEEASQQVLDVLDGRPARYAVNAPLLTPETARAIAPYLPLAETLGRFFAQYSRGRRADPHPRGRGRARRPTTSPRSRPRSCAGSSRTRRTSGSTWSTRRRSPRAAGSRSSSAGRRTPGPSRRS